MSEEEKTDPLIPVPSMISDCCDAPMEPEHKDPRAGQTNFMVCSKCKKSSGFRYVGLDGE